MLCNDIHHHREILILWCPNCKQNLIYHMDRVKRIWYLSLMRAAKVQASLRIHAVLPEPSLLAHTSSESRGIFRQKTRSVAPLNGWACAVKICHDRMLEDTNSLDAAHMMHSSSYYVYLILNSLIPLEKKIRCLAKPCILSFFPTCLIRILM